MSTRTYIPIKVESEGHEHLRPLSAQPPSFPPTHRHSRESGNPGIGRTRGTPVPAKPPKLPKSTGNYRKLPALAIFPTRRIPSKSPETRPPTVTPAQPPSFPRKRESRDGPGAGHFHAPTANPPNHPKLPKSTGNYRKLPAIAIFPTRWIPSKSPETHPPTVSPAPTVIPAKAGIQGWPGRGEFPRPNSQPAEPPKLPKSTGNYRKLPAIAIFPRSTNTKSNR